MLVNACSILSKLNDPDYVFPLFQLFRSAYHAFENNNWGIDDLAPNGWRNWMIHEMEGYSKILKESYQYDIYSTNLHNLGFLYQYMDYEINKNGKCDRKHLFSAIKKYKEALEIRTYLCDSRSVAQSKVRICQCYISLIKNCPNYELSKKYCSKICDYIKDVELIYARIPQQKFRYDDVEQLKREVKMKLTSINS